jgi:hypothetical protein
MVIFYTIVDYSFDLICWVNTRITIGTNQFWLRSSFRNLGASLATAPDYGFIVDL